MFVKQHAPWLGYPGLQAQSKTLGANDMHTKYKHSTLYRSIVAGKVKFMDQHTYRRISRKMDRPTQERPQ